MNKKYILPSSENTARFTRIIAKAIDIFIVFFASIFFYPLGIIIAAIYIAICDSLQSGQSVGKKLMGFSVVSLEDGRPCSFKQSIIRNLPILIPVCLAIIPLWGWVLAILVGLPLIILELYLLFRIDSGHRLGDVMADTTVIGNDSNRVDIKKKKSQSWFKSGNATT